MKSMYPLKLLNFTGAFVAFVVLTLFSVGAQATVVSTLARDTNPPNTDILCRSVDASATLVQNCWTAADAPKNGGGNPGTSKILSYFDDLDIGFDSKGLLYKADYDDGKEEGPLAGSYSTIFGPASGDVENATITYEGGSSVDCSSLANPCFVLIKGAQSPYSYLFNLALGWDPDPRDENDKPVGDGNGWSSNAIGTPSWSGTVELALRHFGDNQLGSISHVALYGNVNASAIPVPAAFWLFGTALLGFIGLSRSTRV
ncbi:MAG: hypothetical protein GY785_05505 [Gammaproteobacteria bacterium]|nr:hypothetical protein [Gammaproteobacteria bacterium]